MVDGYQEMSGEWRYGELNEQNIEATLCSGFFSSALAANAIVCLDGG